MRSLTAGFLVPAFVLLITTCGSSPVARAGSITIPGLPGLVLLLTPQVVSVGGISTDGANFSAAQTMPVIASVSAGGKGVGGSSSVADAYARGPVLGFPGFATTNAQTKAGVGQTSAAFAIAKAGATISASVAVKGMFTVKLDPYMVNQSNASSSMSYQLIFNGQTLFSAGATLMDGSLTTDGAFSSGSFDVVTSSSSTTATLLAPSSVFSVPFSISGSDLNQNLSFEFDETFNASASNGGFASVVGVPEPSTLVMGGIASLVGLACLWRRRRCASSSRVGCMYT